MNKYDETKVLELLERSALETDARVNKSPNGHLWETRPDGHVDLYVGDFHSTVTCATCGYSYCIHCHHDGAPDICKK